MSRTMSPTRFERSTSLSRSEPTILIDTSAREPAMSWFVRSSIGCETETNVDGTSVSILSLSFSLSSSKLCALVQVFRGFSGTRMSVLLLPTASSAISARPLCPSAFAASGKERTTFSASRSRRRASSSETLGARCIARTQSPSKIRGTNSAPAPEKRAPAPTSASRLAPTSGQRNASARSTTRS